MIKSYWIAVKLMFLKRIFVFFGLSFLLLNCAAPRQAAAQPDLGVYAGIGVLRFKDEKDINAKLKHAAHDYGFDISWTFDRWSFATGVGYRRLSVAGDEDAGGLGIFKHRDNIHIARIPVNAGYMVLSSTHFKIVALLGAAFDFPVGIDENANALDLNKLAGVLPFLRGGAEIRYNSAFFRLLYSNSAGNLINARQESKARGFEIAVGYRF